MLLCALILSQLDCINLILTNTLLTTTKPYQKVQNQAAWIIYKKDQLGQCNILHETASLATNQTQELL